MHRFATLGLSTTGLSTTGLTTTSLATIGLAAALLGLGGCTLPPADSSGSAASAAAADGSSESSVSLDALLNRGTNVLTIKNTSGGALVLQRVVVNGQEGADSCNNKLFVDMANAASRDVSLGDCGVVRSTKVYTDHGTYSSDWTYEPFIDLSVSSGSITVKNLGINKYVVQSIILNHRKNDSNCDIKVFRDLDASGSLDVYGTDQCGEIKHYEVVTDKGTREFGDDL
ncbi:MAG TPA: hypothetical protein VFF98_09595 [Novosphingobium sp.]|nr:hypothetical protein [Novosphingobium sp.]